MPTWKTLGTCYLNGQQDYIISKVICNDNYNGNLLCCHNLGILYVSESLKYYIDEIKLFGLTSLISLLLLSRFNRVRLCATP